MESIVEGWILYTSEPPIFWLVKGYSHPEEGYIAVPYRRVDGGRLDPAGYRAATPPWLLTFIPCIGRIAPLISRRRVARVLDPSAALRIHGLPGPLRELMEALGAEWAGLTGSRLTGHSSKGSDYDLLVYSSKPWEAVKALRDLAGEGLIEACDGMRGSLVDACYRGYPYTLRLLESITRASCEGFTASLGRFKTRISLAPAGYKAYTVPARYEAVLHGLGEAVLETWRTRYQGLKPGCYHGVVEVFERGGVLVASPDIGGWLEWVGGSCGPTGRRG